jgi:hypothetical protein
LPSSSATFAITDEGSKLQKGTYIGTVKLHGTNITIVYTLSNRETPQFQSRNQIITPTKDNMGAAAFLSKAPLRPLIDEIMRIYEQEDFTEVLIAGEWAGEGIHKGIALSSLPRFYAIFNIRIDGHWVDLRKYKTVHSPEHRIYNIMNFTTYSKDIDFQTDTSDIIAEMENLTNVVASKCPVGAELKEDLSALMAVLSMYQAARRRNRSLYQRARASYGPLSLNLLSTLPFTTSKQSRSSSLLLPRHRRSPELVDPENWLKRKISPTLLLLKGDMSKEWSTCGKLGRIQKIRRTWVSLLNGWPMM